MNVTLFQASAENSEPTCATARIVSVPTITIGPPTPTCTACCAPSPAFRQKCPPKFVASACAFRPSASPNNASPSSAETLAAVNTFWISAPVFNPKIFTTERKTTSRMATRFCVLIPTSMLPRTMGPT